MQTHLIELDPIFTKLNIGNAATSWSGYLYQGKVAIYTVLCLINQLMSSNKEISAYSLEIEGLEDFSIMHKDKYFSIHQVKSNQDKRTIGGYKDAVLELLGKSLFDSTIKESSLHTAIKINKFDKSNLIDELKNYDPPRKKDVLNLFKNILFDKNNFDIAWKKFKFNEWKGEIKVDKVVQVNEINDKIKEQIKIFFENDNYVDTIIMSSENIDHVFYNLIHKINNLITNFHVKNIERPILHFSEVLDILRNKSVFEFTNETAASLLMDDLTTYFEEYCEEQGINLELDKETARIWDHHINILKKLSPDDFLYVCRKISPNIHIKNTDNIGIREYKRLMDANGVKQVLFKCIFNLHHLLEAANNKNDIFLIKHKTKSNLITIIINEQSKNILSKLGRDIIHNLKNDGELLKLLYDVNVYINKSIKGEYTGTITDVQSEMQEQVKEKFTVPKKIKFLDLNSAMEEFRLNV